MTQSPADAAGTLERLRDVLPSRDERLSESDYLAVWRRLTTDVATGGERAFAGGLGADRLAWVFVAGYQSAIRATLPEIRSGVWAAFAATEDRSDENPLPGVTMEDGGESVVLCGHKTWIAACDAVDQIVVTVGRRAELRCVLVERAEAGAVLTRRDRPRFLADLSQGRLALEDVELPRTRILDASRVRHFGKTEAVSIYVAFCAFVHLRSGDSGCRKRALELADEGLSLLALPPGARIDHLAEYDTGVQELLASASDAVSQHGDWTGDRRLIEMYSRGLQRS